MIHLWLARSFGDVSVLAARSSLVTGRRSHRWLVSVASALASAAAYSYKKTKHTAVRITRVHNNIVNARSLARAAAAAAALFAFDVAGLESTDWSHQHLMTPESTTQPLSHGVVVVVIARHSTYVYVCTVDYTYVFFINLSHVRHISAARVEGRALSFSLASVGRFEHSNTST